MLLRRSCWLLIGVGVGRLLDLVRGDALEVGGGR